jgi:hypothetical protein
MVCGLPKPPAAARAIETFVFHDAVDHLVSAGRPTAPAQPNTRIVKHPHAVMFVREDNIDGVHRLSVLLK